MESGVHGLAVAEMSASEKLELPGLRKAAILIIALGGEVAAKLFQSLTELDVQRLADEIARMGEIPAAQLLQVLSEFYGLLERQEFVARGGSEHASRSLMGALGTVKAEEMLAQANSVRERTTGDLAMLQKMEPQQLSKFLENEHPQTVALVLAHLDAKHGSKVLMHLGAQMRVDALQRLAEMRQFSPEMAQKVALALHRRMDSLGPTERKSYPGYKAVAELLNRLDQGTSDGILVEIEQKEPKVATEIRMMLKAEPDHDHRV